MAHTLRGLWVWTTADLLGDDNYITEFVSECNAARVTQVYLYLDVSDYTERIDDLRSLLTTLATAGIDAWGMEGSRAFFSHTDGPGQLYATVDALIAFNDAAPPMSRFVGFQSDVEFTGGHYPDPFHCHKATRELTPTHAQERRDCLTEWLCIHDNIRHKTSTAKIRLGAAVPAWFDSYCGEPLMTQFGGLTKTMMEHAMDILDDYCVMSYSVYPTEVQAQMHPLLTQRGHKVRVFAGIETHTGVGETISYGDNGASKTTVMKDICALEHTLSRYANFAGINIHDWQGLRQLR